MKKKILSITKNLMKFNQRKSKNRNLLMRSKKLRIIIKIVFWQIRNCKENNDLYIFIIIFMSDKVIKAAEILMKKTFKVYNLQDLIKHKTHTHRSLF